MRIAVTLIIEMDRKQVSDWADGTGIEDSVRTVAADVRTFVAEALRGDFDNAEYGTGAQVYLKGASQ